MVGCGRGGSPPGDIIRAGKVFLVKISHIGQTVEEGVAVRPIEGRFVTVQAMGKSSSQPSKVGGQNIKIFP
jgi:hypothetical protein